MQQPKTRKSLSVKTHFHLLLSPVPNAVCLKQKFLCKKLIPTFLSLISTHTFVSGEIGEKPEFHSKYFARRKRNFPPRTIFRHRNLRTLQLTAVSVNDLQIRQYRCSGAEISGFELFSYFSLTKISSAVHKMSKRKSGETNTI